MNKIEHTILNYWNNHSEKSVKSFNMRDRVIISSNGIKEYSLWETPLVRMSCTGELFINISSEHGQDYKYYSYGRPRQTIITKTTKSRLNAFLSYYGFNPLEVHSSIREWCVKYNGNKLRTDKWYKLDMISKVLIEI